MRVFVIQTNILTCLFADVHDFTLAADDFRRAEAITHGPVWGPIGLLLKNIPCDPPVI